MSSRTEQREPRRSRALDVFGVSQRRPKWDHPPAFATDHVERRSAGRLTSRRDREYRL